LLLRGQRKIYAAHGIPPVHYTHCTGHGNTINAFVEPQHSVFRSGVGVPPWQIFAGANFQFAL
jgi:hypothetical protein